MDVVTGRRGAIAFFVSFCVCLVAAAVALNVGWVVLNWRDVGLLLTDSEAKSLPALAEEELAAV